MKSFLTDIKVTIMEVSAMLINITVFFINTEF